MKKIYIVFFFLINCLYCNAQLNGNFKTVRFVNVLDSTTVLPINGSIYYNEQSHKFRKYANNAWSDLSGAAGGTGNVIGSFTAPRIPYASALHTLTDNAGLSFNSGTGTLSSNLLTVGTAVSKFTVDAAGSTTIPSNLSVTADATIGIFSGTAANITLANNNSSQTVTLGTAATALTYSADYSGTFVDRSLPDKAYVDTKIGRTSIAASGDIIVGASTTTAGGTNALTFAAGTLALPTQDANNVLQMSGTTNATALVLRPSDLTISDAANQTQFAVSSSNGISGNTAGDNLLLKSGDGFASGNTIGGNISLTAGNANGSGTPGSITLTTGTTSGGTLPTISLAGQTLLNPQSTTQYAVKFQSGTNLTSAQAGVIEYNGNWFFTNSTPTRLIPALISGGFTAGRIPFGSTTNLISDSGNITFITPLFSTVHIGGLGSAPTIAAGAGAGTGPTVTVSTATDAKGLLNITTGTTPTASAIVATITFATAYGAAPIVTLTAANAIAATIAITAPIYVTSTTTTFVINSTATALTASTAYVWTYHIIQ